MHLGIRGKLFVGFGAVLVLLAIVGLVGLRNTTEFSNDFKSLYGNRLVAAVEMNAVQQGLYELRLADLSYNDADGQGKVKIKSEQARWVKQIDDNIKAYSNTPLVPEEKNLLKAWQQAYPAYLKNRQDALDQADQNNTAMSQALMQGEVAKPFTEANDAVDKLIQIQDRVGKASYGSVSNTADLSIKLLLAVIVAALAVGFGVAFFLARGITSGVNRVVKASRQIAGEELPSFVRVARALAAGDLTQDVAVATDRVSVSSKDEIGILAGDFNQIIDGLQETGAAFAEMRAGLQDMVGQVQGSANGLADTSKQLGEASGQTGAAVQQVTQAIQNVAAGAQDTSRSAQATNEAVVQLSKAIDAIASGANEQARQVQAVSATATQMAAGVQQVAANADTVANASRQTKLAAVSGAQAVQETVAGMGDIRDVVTQAAAKVGELGKLGEKIGAVVETIDDIAEQTNLLALNAAIEAARAGEHGMGFAVVADEVRKLAERSQRETKAIADLIQEVQAGTQEAVRAMESGSSKVEQGSAKADQAGKALTEILEAVEATVDQVSDIATAAQEMASSSGSVVEAMQAIHTVVEQNSAATEEMAAQATQVLESIQSIAAASEEQSAATEEVSASAEEMSAQVEEMSAQAQELAATAEQLQGLVTRFKLDQDDESNVIPLRKVA